ncbi:DUF3099 domain-containing protein [Paeniglutamicibacter kerguelensis]|uniref:DUF3099 domain-containing protein n=1 Tax=Paeniglutamicibacter kerguelensis TaxID=254788 RepID=A0ABS4XBF2_9MICC|nr:DUF3099 domain-containing protein [Paeniglutamicibacter kerguelensis]MBP2385800.1 hypothetical protein [Paeniglutamicibacter kerguelensis]
MSEPHSSHHHHEHGPQVHRITEARESHTVEQNSRVLKYTISMSVRMLCFLAAFFTHGWIQWVCFAGAIVLPYVAVVIANGGADLTKREPPAEFFAGDEPRSLTASPEPDSQASHEADPGRWTAETEPDHYPQDAPVTIDGSFVDEPEAGAATSAQDGPDPEGAGEPKTEDGK